MVGACGVALTALGAGCAPLAGAAAPVCVEVTLFDAPGSGVEVLVPVAGGVPPGALVAPGLADDWSVLLISPLSPCATLSAVAPASAAVAALAAVAGFALAVGAGACDWVKLSLWMSEPLTASFECVARSLCRSMPLLFAASTVSAAPAPLVSRLPAPSAKPAMLPSLDSVWLPVTAPATVSAAAV